VPPAEARALASGSCGLSFDLRGRLFDTLGPAEREERAAEVEAFYNDAPFPGYSPGDDGAALMDRCRAAPYLRQLDQAISPEARVLDCGCGTGQIPMFLALAGPRRTVVAVDGCRNSLALAEEFRARAGVDNLRLVRADLFDLPLPREQYDVVHSRGVVHHTPDPERATNEVAARVAPGGYLVLGFYETWGRAFHCTRRALGKALRGGEPLRALDPILRRRDFDEEKQRIWIQDQYKHPLEKILPLPAVVRHLEQLGFDWVRTLPPVVERGTMLDGTRRPGVLGLNLRRLGWLLRGPFDHDAGLVAVVMRKPA